MVASKKVCNKKVAIASILLATTLTSYAQVTRTLDVEIKTVKVYPSQVSGDGWENLETIVNQNVDSLSLYQDFNRINSAYPIESAAWRLNREAIIAEREEQKSEASSQEDQEAASDIGIDAEVDTSTATTSESASTTTATEAEIEIDNTTVTSTEETVDDPEVFDEVETSSVGDDANVEEVDVDVTTTDEEVVTENSSTTEPLSFVSGVFDYVFARVTDVFPFVQSATSTESEIDETEVLIETDEEVVPEAEVVASSTVTESVPETEEEADGEPVGDIASSTDVETTEDVAPLDDTASTTASATSSDDGSEAVEVLSDQATSTESTNDSDQSDETETVITDEECVDDCVPYVITLGDFGLPIFDDGAEMSGAQLRMSFAAKRKATRDEVQSLTIKYSFNGGVSWSDSGAIIIDEEASNSINGGYYLFALPDIADPEMLDNLAIQIVYDEDPSDMEGLFVESAWLELFTVENQDVYELSERELLADNGFNPILPYGDELTLPDGSVVTFNNTDENTGETLIVKSDSLTYEGLTKVTSYVNVTNTSDQQDEFMLKAYFPTQQGEVTSIEEWNPNKPKTIIVPEYRPFVYHCQSGWEQVDSPIGASLLDISRELTPDDPTDIDPAPTDTTVTTSSTAAGGTAAAPLEDIPTSTSTETDAALDTEEATTSTSTLSVAQLVFPFAQAVSATTSIDDLEFDLTEVIVEDDAEVDGVEYICRGTNIVRSCDMLEGDNTACRQENVKVQEHELTRYEGGWEPATLTGGEPEDDRNLLKRATDFLGFGPDIKDVPPEFEVRAHTPDGHLIAPGETKYFKFEIEFPPFSAGEFWVEAIGDSEYGLLDPFWSSQWQYRIPLTIDNTGSNDTLTDHQVFIELDSTLTDFWANVNNDGSDIRFVQETVVGNEEGWYATGWTQRVPITIQASQVDADLSDFPVYVDLSDLGASFFSGVQSDGADIRVTEADGQNELPYELVAIDTIGDSGELHFKANTISSSEDTVFYIYFNNPNVSGYSETDTFGAEAVWTAYEAVYHLDETGSSHLDSTANSHDGTEELAGSTVTTGLMGDAQDFAGNGRIDVTNGMNANLISAGEYQVSAWVNLDTSAGDQSPVAQYSGAGDFLFWADTGDGGDGFCHFNGTYMPSDCRDQNNQNVGTWQHVVAYYDGTDGGVYLDGVETGAGPTGSTFGIDASIPFGIGSESGDSANRELNGQIDEVRISSTQFGEEWAAAEFVNQNTPNTFYTVGAIGDYTLTSFSELDHWVQHFSTSTDEADVWVQVDTLAANASTTIYLYYGSPGAISTSDEFAPFTYDTLQDLYYVVHGDVTTDITLHSLIDNNQIQVDGGTVVDLDKGVPTTISGYASTSVIRALGPITSRQASGGAEPVVPIAFATTTNIALTERRSPEDFHIYSPFGSTSVQVYDLTTPVASQSVATGTVEIVSFDITNAAVIESTLPILQYNEGQDEDSYVSYPPTTRDLFGFHSQAWYIGTAAASTDYEVYCGNNASSTSETVTRGQQGGDNLCSGAADVADGSSVRVTNQTNPVAAIQEADSDGGESTTFLPELEFGTEYYISTGADYVAAICTPRFGTSTIEIYNGGGSTVTETLTCAPGDETPSSVRFTNGGDGDSLEYNAGTRVVSNNDVPFYLIYDEDGGNETNSWSAVQARKYSPVVQPVSFGAQEINIDAEYEQLSFGWYQNANALTPTSTWEIGDDGNVAEQEDITGQGALNVGDVARLRLSLRANSATGTASSTAFNLQYSAADTCTTATNWSTVGQVGSTTAAFAGFNNSGVDDGIPVTSTLLASSTVFATYEEANLSALIPNEIGVNEVAEWDWVITSTNAADTNTVYCFRMIRSSGDVLNTYSVYPQLLTSGPPDAPVLLERFDNEHASSTRPGLEFVASDASGDDLHYQIQVDNDVDFSSAAFDEDSSVNFSLFTNVQVAADKAPFTSGQIIRFDPDSDLTSSTTYWWRVRAIDPDGSNSFSEWSDSYSFTINESISVSEWYQTTNEQFDTNSLISATTSGGAITADVGGSGVIGEYASLEIGNNTTTTISYDNSYTNPVIVASLRFPRSVADGEQRVPRIINKGASDFDVIAVDFNRDAAGSSTVDYMVIEAGEYFIDDGDDGVRLFATSTSVSSYQAGAGSDISTDIITFPTSFGSSPMVIASVTSNNDPDYIIPHVYSGSNDNTAPSATEVKLYLSDNRIGDGHTQPEDVDVVALDFADGTNDSVAFDVTTSVGSVVTDAPFEIGFDPEFAGTPGTVLVQKLTNTGGDGGYAMVDTDNPVTSATATVAIDEFEDTSTNRAHGSAEQVGVLAFAASSGDIIRSGEGQITSTPINFADADVGNAWGEIDWNDSGDITYRVQYQTGSGFIDIPDADLPGNSTGFTSGPVNILNLDTITYNELRLTAEIADVAAQLFDWRVTWGQRVDIPTLGDLFDNEQTAATTPTFDFVTTDPQGDTLQYQISLSTDDDFELSSTTRTSGVALGFSGSSPYASGDTVTFTLQAGDALTDGETYWWRVRARDPAGSNAWSPWSDPDSFTIDTATLVSTWHQTTAEQFEEGTLDGLTASSSGSVEITTEIGEYGSTTLTNNAWSTINTDLSYNNMVVVASPEYDFNGTDNGRTVQVRGKTNNSFEIKVENYTESFTGTTLVDYIVMEAGDWSIDDGGAGMRVVAGTAEDVSTVKGSIPGYGGGTQVDFNPDFSAAPGALVTVSSNNDTSGKWVGTVVDNGTQFGEVGLSDMFVSLGISLDTDTVRLAENIDYVVFEEAIGETNGVLFDAFNTATTVTESETESNISFNQTFTSAPSIAVLQNNGTEGGDGGFALQDTSLVTTNTRLYASIAEIGASAGNHAAEVVSVWAFESNSGTIRRQDSSSGNLQGTIASEPILFSDGAGPKFERAIISSSTPGTSSTTMQFEYLVSTSTWILIPDSQIPGNSLGVGAGIIDLTSVDIATYDTVRMVATLQCGPVDCPTLDDWTIEWSEGVPLSGTIREYDRATNVTSGTVQVAVNGTPGNTGTIAGDGTFTINNVTAFDGDTVTVWMTGADEADEAVSVFVYDGIGDMTGIELFEQHLTISSDENATTTNTALAAYDNSVSGNEDIFFDVDGNNDLSVCAIAGCGNANLYLGSGQTFVPDETNSGNVATHDFINNGTFDLDSNTMRVSGSWDDNSTTELSASTVIFTATTTTETIDDSDNVLNFNNVTFGETTGAAVWQSEDPYDIDGALQIEFGTLDRPSSTINVAGNVTVSVAGFIAGISTTTFDGPSAALWTDNNSVSQNVGRAVIDGDGKTITLQSDVLAENIFIGANDTLNAGGANTLSVRGDFTNTNTFVAQTGTLEISGLSTNAVITAGGSSLHTFSASTTGNGMVSFAEANVTMLGDFLIATGTVTMPSATTSVGGSFGNTGGIFAHNNGEVRFTGSGAETIELQGAGFFNSFYDVRFSGSGEWTFLDTDATTTNRFTVANGNVVMPSGQLSVGSDFTTSGGGSFSHNDGELLLLIQGPDTITTNGSNLNDVTIQAGGGVGTWLDANWLYRLPVTVRSSVVDDDLTNFPVYVNLSDLPSDFFSNLNSDGGDIRITTEDALTEVPREVVSASTTAQTGEIHFLASSLSSTTDTTFYIYYGNSAASDYATSDPNGAEAVWTAYEAVYHLDETGSSHLDSTANSHDGTEELTGPTLAGGRIGDAQDFTANGRIDVTNGMNANLISAGEYQVSAWVNLDTSGADQSPVAQYAGAGDLLFWADTGDGGTGFCHFNGTYMPSDCQDLNNQNAGTWQHVVAYHDGTNGGVYLDGVETGAGPTGSTFGIDASIPFGIGSQSGDSNAREFDGQIDEVRISSTQFGEEWAAAEFTNQSTTTDFYAIGVPQQESARTFADTNVTTIGDVTIVSGMAVLPTGVMSIGGSLDNNSEFDSNMGTVAFTATATAETIAVGSSTFYTLNILGPGGDIALIENATATNDINLIDAGTFTVNSGITLESTGQFSNALSNASTTWTGATLRLSGGSDFSINDKANEGDDYNILTVTGDGDISMWNSTASTYDTQDTASIYSQDHDAVDGDLYIFGDYVRDSGTEYWSYTTDFDGVDLVASSTERQVNVRVANGASVTASSSTLLISGTSTASTTVDAQAGSFSLAANTATVTASYFTMTGTDADGFQLLSSSTVTLLDNALFNIPTASAAVTVDASTVDTTPTSQFFNTNFATAGGNVNVTLSGTPNSFWWFREGNGDRYGEAFDNADGNPGNIQWDDSAFQINISGTVYSDDGLTTMAGPTCDGSSNAVTIVVDGGAYTDTVACDGLDGGFDFTGVSYNGDATMVIYLNDTLGGDVGSVITRTPTVDITDLDIYADRVMTRQEDSSPMTIERMALYDEADDSDLRFSAATSTLENTLTVLPDNELFVFASTTFAPGGPVTLASGGTGNIYDGTLQLGDNASFTGVGTTTYQIGGSLILNTGATLATASSTFEFTATTSGKTLTAPSTLNFNELEFTGNGAWNVNAAIEAAGDIEVADGTLTGTGDITLTNGSFFGNGLVSLGGGTTQINQTNTLGGTQGWTFNNLTLGNALVVGTTTTASNATTTIAGVLTISSAHFLDAASSVWNLTGSGNVFVEDGVFLEGTSRVQYGGSTGANVLATTYYDLVLNAAGGSPTYVADSTGFEILSNLQVGGAATTTFTLDTNDPVVAVNGDVLVRDNGTLVGSDTTPLAVGGSWDNDGSFTSSNGQVNFVSTDAFSIAAGASSFGVVNINGIGAATVTENATSTGAWTLATTSDFTVGSGQRLAVGSDFNNNAAGAATTWTGSALHLFGAGQYEINASTTADQYSTLSAASGTHIRIWNSEAITYDTAAGGSVYSMDHENVTGDLYIFGDYVQDSAADYWSYATDFDGTDLSGGNERAVSVLVENGGSFTIAGGSLDILGTSSASTTIVVQGAGTYSADITGGSFDASYYAFANLDTEGLTFTGAPTIGTLSRGLFTIGANNGRGFTAAGSVIDANPAKNFSNNVFATSSGVTVAYNGSTTGATVSSWRFTTHSGDVDGEGFDLDGGGDPGYLVWDDSTPEITIAGFVYENDGTTVSSVCGANTNIVLAVDGIVTSAASTSCDGTGFYSISNVSFSPNDTLTLFIKGEADQGATVSIDPISTVGNMNIYEDHLIVRHEGADPITIADLADYDNGDDADMPFTATDAVTDSLVLDAETKLIVWDSKTFEPLGNITTGGGAGGVLDGTLELQDDATIIFATGETHSLGGNIESGAGATFTPGESAVTLTSAGAGRTIDTNEFGFYDLTINGTGSFVSEDSSLAIANDLSLTNGALTLSATTTVISGSLTTTAGSFDANGGEVIFNSTTAETVTSAGSDFHELTFTGAGSWAMNDVNATATAGIRIETGTLTLPSGTLATLGDFRNASGTVANNGSRLVMATSSSATLFANGSDLFGVTFTGGGDYQIEDASLTFLDDLIINNATATFATGTLSIGGSFDATAGTFDNATGTVLFISTSLGETVDPGDNDFYNVSFGSGSGGWILADNATATNNFTLAAAQDFTLQSGSRLYVGNVFTNNVGGLATDWSGTTLVLDAGTQYTINTKSTGGDDYDTIEIGANTDIRAWESQVSTTVLTDSSSLYSQDNAAVDGDLYIYGNFEVSTSTEYWNYDNDFDGTFLGAGARQVNVYIAENATTTVNGGNLEIVGDTGATTTVQNQGVGTYAFVVSSGSFDTGYYSYRNLDINGLILTGTSTVTGLSNGDFELAVNGGSLITLSSSTLSANPSLFIDRVRFATTTAISGFNVNLNATTSNAWTFRDHAGGLSGEAYNIDGVSSCGSIRWDDSSCLLVEQTHYRWRNDDGGLGVNDADWFNVSWGKRQSVRIENNDNVTYGTTSVKLNITHDTDMQADFEDLRFTASDGVTVIPHWTEEFSASSEATVWVQIPELVGNSAYQAFMYYDNVSATSTSSSTPVFVAVDDFEDNNLTEYSGDTGEFQTAAASAFGGSYGVEPVTDTNFTGDGIARFDQALNQGEIIRYMQYVDTGSGSGDEACVLFGVQSPATASQNYAVCLVQFLGERIEIVRDAERGGNSGTSVELANESVSFSTGWYEIEIDWQIDNSITAQILDDSGVLIGTATATDSTYSSGGYGFTYWGQHGGWDSFTSRNRTDSAPSVFFGGEQTDGGATWNADLDEASRNIEIGDVARLRLAVENSGLNIVDQEYQLEYAAIGSAPSCESLSSAAFAAVPDNATCGSSPMCMATSSFFADGAIIADLLTDTNGTYESGYATEDPSNTAVSIDLNQNRYTELEYALSATVNASDSAYCLRVTNSGDVLDSYGSVAEFALQFPPQMSAVTFNNGDDISLVGGTTTRVFATTSVTDFNGYTDLVNATGTFFRSDVTAACADDPNNCYVETLGQQCTFTNCSGNSCDLECYADFFYFASSTDDFGGEFWYAFLEVEDSQGGGDFETSFPQDVLTLNAIDVSEAINYTAITASSTTGANNATTSILNIGNNSIDINLEGIDLSDGGSSIIPTEEQKFATSSFNYDSCITCTNLSTTTIPGYELDLVKPTSTADVADVVYWGIRVPFGTASNAHTGINTFYAVND